ncbi:MAG: hypothetical protein BWX88_05214 [Planctomycetes bacterium ADurb.Bin126]|nr:MAG: hypothetical protein BWX88_05214 [Planctomycetes bacterium ADurb.Bin126]
MNRFWAVETVPPSWVNVLGPPGQCPIRTSVPVLVTVSEALPRTFRSPACPLLSPVRRLPVVSAALSWRVSVPNEPLPIDVCVLTLVTELPASTTSLVPPPVMVRLLSALAAPWRVRTFAPTLVSVCPPTTLPVMVRLRSACPPMELAEASVIVPLRVWLVAPPAADSIAPTPPLPEPLRVMFSAMVSPPLPQSWSVAPLCTVVP